MNEATGELCAIKEMRQNGSFERELRAMNSIPSHVHISNTSQLTVQTNVLHLLDNSKADHNMGYLVFELCQTTLESMVTDNLDEFAVARFTDDMLAALEHLNLHNCIHRDLKLAVLLFCFLSLIVCRIG